ncbi:MAG: dihydrofolate reductase [Candidatus Methylopumilus sp.]|jgi:dihydrofolate reductase|nr:dihydrofolate reductase [Candidatus Methylopumilus sp.]NBW60150.1 dihydrofolate reductase [Methylophilaceae bacterium]
MMSLSVIVALAKNRVIGLNNTLPWHLPEDLKRFKQLTMGHHIIMGRKTYESLGRLLPGRQTVIVTRNPDYKVDGAIVVHSLEQAISVSSADSEAFLIGGAELYQQSLPLAKRLYLTMIDAEFEGDAYFPEIELDHWDLLEQQDLISQQGWAFHYLSYQRKA